MILQALNEHYYRLLGDKESKIAPQGYSIVDISFVIVLSQEGEFLDLFSVEKEEFVPEHKKRSGVHPAPYFLCDKILYSLGVGKDKNEGKKRFELYRDYNLKLLQQIECVEAIAVSNFLKAWNPESWDSNAIIMRYQEEFNKPKNFNTVYRIDGQLGYVHQNTEITSVWMNELAKKEEEELVIGQCLVSGKIENIARTHNVAIKGAGGQPAGTALVSFQIESFRSYGKTQSYNAPVSKKVAFAYGTALNYLIDSDTNRVRLADTTMVFWADKKGGKAEETVLAWCLDPVAAETGEESEKRRIDPSAARQAKAVLERVKSGLPVGDTEFNPETRCYLLGLAPNAARLSVRFWQVSSFGDVLEKIAHHYTDMDIAGIERLGGTVSPWRTLKAIAVQEDTKNIPPLLGGQLLKTILSGEMYPQPLYNAAIMRCRTGGEHGGVNTIRAAVIKAFLARKYRIQKQKEKEAMITVSLNEKNTNNAYLLGRLFSLLEKVQKDALGNNINATIRDRYFGAASATPGAVFPLLLRLSRHHISKSEYGNLSERKIQEVMNGLDAFPAHLNMEEQGLFILGYYHQNQANYVKNENNK
ncbi:type I-C CRISPR-associated protein Cas8c/Csd1 [Pelotomaculum propionicicum]|uniref:type I-C CRISPR-associated protein Cas8c/Csd1 n=1 Tax=Pelotomaculum propionicicum TaxID=258475 RepID=UPI003B7C42FC